MNATAYEKKVATITQHVGRCNVDIMGGWEAGMQGKERIGRSLFSRLPPSHLTGQRMVDWIDGRDAAVRFKGTRLTCFIGDGVEVTRKGWVQQRGKVLSQMEKAGARGDVLVLYMEAGHVVRKLNCGI